MDKSKAEIVCVEFAGQHSQIPDSIAVDSNGDGKVDKVVKLPNDLDMGNL